MSELKIINDKKVDHPRKKSKDLSDAVTGAVFGALSHTPKNTNIEIEIHTWSSSSSQVANTQQSMIELDSQKIPENVRDYLDQFKLI
jgi:hypothetical protein